MDQTNGQINMDMLMFIINQDGKNNNKEILKLAADKGIHGGTVMLGEGRAQGKLLRLLGIDSLRREIVILIAPTDMAKAAFEYISQEATFGNKESDVGFRLPLSRTTGISKGTIDTEKFDQDYENEPVTEITHQLIINVGDVDRGEVVLDTIEEQGGLYGTIVHGRGAASHEIEHVFNMDIEPEKDVLLTIVPTGQADTIMDKVSEEFDIDDENKGILFAANLAETVGLSNKN